MTTFESDESRGPSVTEQLLSMLTDGTIGAGERIREADIARRCGVSRTPVRDSIRELAGAGVLVLEPNRGARVRSYSIREIEQIYRSRALVESHLAALAVPEMTEQDVAHLKELAAEMRELGDDPARRTELSQLNNRFHRYYISRVEGHPLISTAEQLMVPLLVSKVMVTYDPRLTAISMDHHDELVTAAEQGDPEWAASLMRTHILSGWNRYRSVVE
ncbi:MAG: GntR family transcriptional regulator [Nesterenkonia sp.]|nr:GntR family transcriptional regulator [Nesterenkonia sp.]